MKSLKTLYAIAIIAMLSNKGICQNLIQNPSFEQYSSCPTTGGQIANAIGWNTYGSSPEYFNTCSSSNSVDIPNNYAGFQYPAFGNGYAGIIAYETIPVNPSNVEFIGQQLLAPLNIGQKYFASFKVNLPRKDTSLTNLNDCIHYASNKLGMLFTNVGYDENNPVPIGNFAHIYSDSIITDTLNWITIGGSFIADQAYTYLSIGVFFDNNQISTEKIQKDSTGVCDGMSYYFVDDVALSIDSLIGLQIAHNYEIQKKSENYSIYQKNNYLIIDMLNSYTENEFLIFNYVGSLIFETKIKSGQLEIDLSKFQNGVYYLTIINDKTGFKNKILISK